MYVQFTSCVYGDGRYYIKVHLLKLTNVSTNEVTEGNSIMYFFNFQARSFSIASYLVCPGLYLENKDNHQR